ncbi:MAG TPA: hypothetical protein VLF67_02500 [Candidatus Saccharimonas sp.]|nr:hypothetical protein [Candidatus Saccharimonas sp.]
MTGTLHKAVSQGMDAETQRRFDTYVGAESRRLLTGGTTHTQIYNLVSVELMGHNFGTWTLAGIEAAINVMHQYDSDKLRWKELTERLHMVALRDRQLIPA